MKKIYDRNLLLALAMTAVAVCFAGAQDAGSAPSAHSHAQMSDQVSDRVPEKDAHQCPMNMQGRGEMAMGFSQTKTTHHFLIKPDGGVIRVEANDVQKNDAKDTDVQKNDSRDEIRMHLAHIAKSFAAGDFDIPMFVHDQVPPGVPVMRAKKDQIQYRYEETSQGGQVVITTADAEALAAIHDFLDFQIREHKTGDPQIAP
jgi:hypothetical protein